MSHTQTQNLQRLKELHELAQRRLTEAKTRYKTRFDRFIREKKKELQALSWVYLRREVYDAGTKPKIYQQVNGPYQIVETDGRIFALQQGEDIYESRQIT
jgi:hypothetical protein